MNKLISSALLKAVFTLFAIIGSSFANAELKQTFGDYEVHYNAFNSTFLQPDVAANYQVQRSKYRGLVNITVLQKQPDGSKKGVRARITGKVKNLIQQTNNLHFRPIVERDAIYHIAEFKIASEDTLTFTLEIQPDSNKPAFTLSFRQTVFPN